MVAQKRKRQAASTEQANAKHLKTMKETEGKVNRSCIARDVPDRADKALKVEETESPLFKLPPELRNRIYKYALQEPRPIVVTTSLKQPPLVCASRQLREEAVKMWYSCNTFELFIYGRGAAFGIRFVKHCNKHCYSAGAFYSKP